MRTIAACLYALVSLRGTTATAGTPFGGDDTGFVPPDRETLRCENKIDRLFHMQTKGLSHCATRQLRHLFAGRVTDDREEQTCKTALDARVKAALDALIDKGLCTHECSDEAHFAQGIVTIEQTVAVFTGLVICEGTVPWPGSGNGGAKIPSTVKILRCELRVGRAALELSGAEDHCQRKLAERRFNGQLSFDDDACHAASEATYDQKVANASGCSPCTHPTLLKTLIRGFIDGQNQGIYCASPSGAFVDHGATDAQPGMAALTVRRDETERRSPIR